MAKVKKRDKQPKASAQPAVVGGGVLAVQARYDAASQGRRMAGWNPPASGPNKALAGLAKIRDRSLDAGRNEWTGASSSRVLTTNLIGVGITARPRTKNKSRKTKLVKEWDRWCEVSDADGVLDFAGQQVLATSSWIAAGEVFGRIRARRIEDGLPVPMQIQLLEAHFCPVFDADSWPEMPDGNRIRSGIEFDNIGRRAAYWMYREHPGDGQSTVNSSQLYRIPADQIIHVYKPLRPGQLRGVPESAPILSKLRSVMDFDDAVLTRQQIANLFAMFVTRPMPAGQDAGIDPLTGKTIQYDADGAPMAGLEPGTSQELLPGEDVKFSSPPDAGANYPDYMRQQHIGVAAGQGIPYELMTGDIKDVSDRTLRVIINEFRRYCEQLQWTIIIPMFCKRVRAAWAQAALLAGVLTERDMADAVDVEWCPHGWPYIHPVQDAQGKQIEIETGTTARSMVISEKGYDPEAVDEARAEDQQREKDLGIQQTAKQPATNQQQQQQTN